MEETILIALISAGSAILASSLTQIIGNINKNKLDKKIDHREYRKQRVSSYTEVFEIVIWMNKTMMGDTTKWASDIATRLENLIIKHGIWLDKDDIKILKKLQLKVSNISANEYMQINVPEEEFQAYKKEYKQRFEGSIQGLQDEILSKTRGKIRKLYGV